MKSFLVCCKSIVGGTEKAIVQSCLLALMITMASCRSASGVIIEKPIYLHDTMVMTNVQKDSVFVHDSIYVYKNGDTLYMTKIVTKSVTKIQHDTIREVQEVPVEVLKTEVREVEKPLRWYHKCLMWLGWLVLIFGTGFLMSWYVGKMERKG